MASDQTGVSREAAAKFVKENQHKRSLQSDISYLKNLMPWIGTLALQHIHLGTPAALDRSQAKGWGHTRNHQSWPKGGEAHPEPR